MKFFHNIVDELRWNDIAIRGTVAAALAIVAIISVLMGLS